jgi:hypothetical protein
VNQKDQVAAQANLRSRLCWSHNHYVVEQGDLVDVVKQWNLVAVKADLRSKLSRIAGAIRKANCGSSSCEAQKMILLKKVGRHH